MKLEPGQVWRRPDGTLWLVASGMAPPKNHTILTRMLVDHLEQLTLPELVVSDTWKLEHHPQPIPRWVELTDEQRSAYATLTGQPGELPDEGT